MARFQIEMDGELFEVEAPDQETALQALDEMVDGVVQAPTTFTNPNLAGTPFLGPLLGMAGFNGIPQLDNGEPWGPPGVLAPVQFQEGTGKMRMAMPSALSDFLGAAQLPGKVLSGETEFDPRVSYKDQDPEVLDQAAILAGAATTSGVPGIAKPSLNPKMMIDEAGQPIPSLLAKDLQQQGIPATAVQGMIDELGPGAVLADISPTLQARLAAIANTAGPGKDMAVEAMLARQKGANNRILAALEGTLGEPKIPSRAAAEIKANKEALSPVYQDVFRDYALGPQMGVLDAAPIIAAIDDVIPRVVGGTRTQIERIRKMLIDPTTGEPTLDPEIIMAVRQELDGMIGAETNTTTAGRLSDLRKAIDIDLGANVPGLKGVDAQFEQQALQQEGFDLGQQALRNKDNPLHPQELADEIAQGALPTGEFIGPSGVPVRIRQGMVADIARIVGTTANDRVALRAILKGEGSWNREKLVAAFGEEKADELIRLFDNEAQMAQTENLAIGNSKTETVRGAKAGIEAPSTEPGFVRNALNFKFGDASVNLLDVLLGKGRTNARLDRNAKIALALLRGTGWKPGEAIPSYLMDPARAGILTALGMSNRETQVSK
jgi:hypothetical protein